MKNFVFKNPTKLIFGKGSVSKISCEIAKDAKIMMIYGSGSIKKNGVYDDVKKALDGYDVTEFSGVEANPKYETLVKAIELGKEKGINYLLAVGGGSVVDATKFIACAINYDDANSWDLLLDNSLLKKVMPVKLAAVLTLPATGSEMNNGAVISRLATAEKLAFHHDNTFPQFSVLDPQYCFSLPKKQVVNGIIDTYIHVMEQYLTCTGETMVQDRFSEGILLTLKDIAPALVKDHTNYDLMSNFMISATMGLNGFVAWGVKEDWATHMIGHELTAFHGLDHGVTLAIVYPALMDVMRDVKKDKILQYADRVWGINAGEESVRIDAAIAKTAAFFESLGVKTHLSDYSITEDTIDSIVRRFEDRYAVFGENQDITPQVVRQILKKAL